MNEKFYNGKQWRKVSRLFLQSKHYICERCSGAGEIAHHKIYLDRFNVGNPEISLSADNLECLCLACHNAEHGETGSATAAGISFDEAGNVVYSPTYPPCSRQKKTNKNNGQGDYFSST